jgi:hypothetical protein
VAEYRPVVVTFANRGLDIRTTDDEVAVESYVKLENLVSDREGSLSTRLGISRRTARPVCQFNIHTIAKLSAKSAAYRYAAAASPAGDSQLYRAWFPYTIYDTLLPGATWLATTNYKVDDLVTPTTANGHVFRCTQAGASAASEPTWSVAPGSNTTDGTVVWTESNFSENAMLWDTYAIGIDEKPWVFFTDKNLFLKDNGRDRPQWLGIVPPNVAPTVAVVAHTAVAIEGFEDATPGTYWTESDPNSVLTLSQEVTIKKVGTSSLKYLISGLVGDFYDDTSITRNVTVNLTGGDSDDDLIHLYLYVTAPLKIQEILLQLSIGGTTFTEYYEKPIIYAAITPGVNWTDTTHQRLRENNYGQAGIEDTADFPPQDPQFQGVRLEPSTNVWTDVQIKKGDFLKVADTASTNDWADVQAIRIKVRTTGAVTIYFDDWAVQYGGLLSGIDYRWKYIYRESVTKTLSNPSEASAELTDRVNQNAVSVTVAYSRAPNVDFIDVYRAGGTVTDYRYSGSVANLPAAAAETVVYTDNTGDAFLTTVLETDNARPPNFAGVVLHNETLFGWGAEGDPPNVVRFSKRVQVEQWPPNYKLFVGSGTEKVIRLISHGEQLFVFTLAQVYRILGTDPLSYTALATGFNRGLINSRFAVCKLPGGLAMISFDGVYEFPSGKKLSQPVDGIFHGEVINGINPMNRDRVERVRLEFFDNKLYMIYVERPFAAADRNI